MMQISQILSQLYSILGCKLALSAGGRLTFYPPEDSAELINEQITLAGYRKLDIEINGSAAFYVEDNQGLDETSLKLAALYINSQLGRDGDAQQSMNRLLMGSEIYSDHAAISSVIEKSEGLYFIVVSGPKLSDSKEELTEIIRHSLDVKLFTEYQDNFAAVVVEEDIKEACSNLQRNIISELFLDCVVAIGGRLQSSKRLAALYNSCLEAFELKKIYQLNQNVLDYEGMIVYRLVASMDRQLKQSIREKIFTESFVDILNNEMELTIEEMFRNNLNLTDTSARLYIHRNTLLYRIDKIFKQTGFDLRKFEDSMIFKLAWLMYKENL